MEHQPSLRALSTSEFTRLMSGPVCTLRVGPNSTAQSFEFPESIMKATCGYVRTVMRGVLGQPPTNTIRVEGSWPSVCNVFAQIVHLRSPVELQVPDASDNDVSDEVLAGMQPPSSPKTKLDMLFALASFADMMLFEMTDVAIYVISEMQNAICSDEEPERITNEQMTSMFSLPDMYKPTHQLLSKVAGRLLAITIMNNTAQERGRRVKAMQSFIWQKAYDECKTFQSMVSEQATAIIASSWSIGGHSLYARDAVTGRLFLLYED